MFLGCISPKFDLGLLLKTITFKLIHEGTPQILIGCISPKFATQIGESIVKRYNRSNFKAFGPGEKLKLMRFDPKASNTSKMVECDADACKMIYGGSLSGCKPQTLCYYEVTYGDGSSSSGS